MVFDIPSKLQHEYLGTRKSYRIPVGLIKNGVLADLREPHDEFCTVKATLARKQVNFYFEFSSPNNGPIDTSPKIVSYHDLKMTEQRKAATKA